MAKNNFIPEKLPVSLDYSQIVGEISDAHSALARYDESLNKLPNPRIVKRTFQTNEAVLSSRIEGTQATLEEVLEIDAEDGDDVSEDTLKERDYKEIFNYRLALKHGEDFLKNNPISENFIKDLYKTLMRSVRGSDKSPGNFRKGKVYIGPPGAGVEDARYIPPLPDFIPDLMSNLLEYINSDKEKDVLVQAAITHYQFEAIHPFGDGNGRVGRILIPLFLSVKDATKFPDLYISEFFEENRRDYYDLLNNISEKDEWIEWIKFFLRGVKIQSLESLDKVNKIEKLYEDLKKESSKFNSKYAVALIDALFVKPIFTPLDIKKITPIKSNQTIYNLVDKFKKAKLIKRINPESQRSKLYVFSDLLEIVK